MRGWIRRCVRRALSERTHSQTGFTLLEVVVAMGILAVGLLAIGAAQLAALHLTAKSRHLTTAMHLAQQTVEQFQAFPISALPSSGNDPNNPIDPDPSDGDEVTFERRWTITPNSPVLNLTALAVEVDWVEPKTGVIRTTRLESLKAQ